MPLIEKPEAKPLRPEFSSGPCAKRPGWDIKQVVCTAYLGRSHRANGPQSQIRDVLGLTKEILEIPENYKVGLVPGSNTGAFEMAMWTLLGKLPVDLFAWENFGLEWVNDVVKQLKLQHFSEDAFVICICGRIAINSYPKSLLEAIKVLRNQGHNIHLLALTKFEVRPERLTQDLYDEITISKSIS